MQKEYSKNSSVGNIYSPEYFDNFLIHSLTHSFIHSQENVSNIVDKQEALALGGA